MHKFSQDEMDRVILALYYLNSSGSDPWLSFIKVISDLINANKRISKLEKTILDHGILLEE